MWVQLVELLFSWVVNRISVFTVYSGQWMKGLNRYIIELAAGLGRDGVDLLVDFNRRCCLRWWLLSGSRWKDRVVFYALLDHEHLWPRNEWIDSQNSCGVLGLNDGWETPPPIIVGPKIGDLCSIGNCPLLRLLLHHHHHPCTVVDVVAHYNHGLPIGSNNKINLRIAIDGLIIGGLLWANRYFRRWSSAV